MCSVGEIVGPPYSLESVTPGSGAITGATKTTVRLLSVRQGLIADRPCDPLRVREIIIG